MSTNYATPSKLASAFRALNVHTNGQDFDAAARSVSRHVRRHSPDPECREPYDLATALGRFDVSVPGLSYDETATAVIRKVEGGAS
jgi:hypothetical protein